MNTIEEIRAFVNAIDCGEPIFNITVNARYGSDVALALEDWPQKEQLADSLDPLTKTIGHSLERKYDIETRSLILSADNLMEQLYSFVQDSVQKLAAETSPTDQPKRTNAYKEIIEIAYLNKRDENYLNDILPIINYYNKSKTDDNTYGVDKKVHMNNVQALFGILRKKYGKSIKKK
jgi:hypothetical protein